MLLKNQFHMSSSVFSFIFTLIIITSIIIEHLDCANGDLCRQWVARKRSLIVMGEVSGNRLLLLDDHYAGFLLPMSALVNVGTSMFNRGAPPPYLSFEDAKSFQLPGTEKLPPRTIPTGAVVFSNEQHSNYFFRDCVGLLFQDGQNFALIPVERSSENASAVVYFPITEDSTKLVTGIFTSIARKDSNSLVLTVLRNGHHLSKWKLELIKDRIIFSFLESLIYRSHFRPIDGGFFFQNATLFGFHNSEAMIRVWNVELGPASIDVHYRDFFKCDTFFLTYNQMVVTLIGAIILVAVFLLWLVLRCQLVGSCLRRSSNCSSSSSSRSSSVGSASVSTHRKSTTISRQLLTMNTDGDSSSKASAISKGSSRKLTTSSDSKLTSSGGATKT